MNLSFAITIQYKTSFLPNPYLFIYFQLLSGSVLYNVCILISVFKYPKNQSTQGVRESHLKKQTMQQFSLSSGNGNDGISKGGKANSIEKRSRIKHED
jgi:hypothetical protein